VVITIGMPKLSDTMSEGKILQWRKAEGDKIRPGEVIAEIESDKSNMEMEVPDGGYLRRILVPAGGSAPIGALIAVMTESPNEDFSEALAKLDSGSQKRTGDNGHPLQARAAEPGPRPEPPAPALPAPPPASPPSAPQPPTSAPPAAVRAPAPAPRGQRGQGRILASPLAFRMAAELGLDLSLVKGSGPDGRIVKRDILEAAQKKSTLPQPAASPPSGAPAAKQGAPYRPAALPALPAQSHEDVPVSSMRRIIGARLVESKAMAPHFYVTVEVDMKRAIQAREQLNSIAGVNVTFNDLVVKAASLALGRHPGINASWQGDFIRYYKSIDIGIAVALPDGLITPVVRGCQLKSLGHISQDIKDLVERARQKRLTADDYKGGTFTISNLGMFGVKSFTAIINPPEACILAVSAILEVPVVENGAVVPGHRMSITLSSDHRVVDGASAAEFLRDLKQLLENPIALAL